MVLTRQQRRRLARMAPPRLCDWCGARLDRVISVSRHIARHLEAEGAPKGYGRRMSEYMDGVPIRGKLR